MGHRRGHSRWRGLAPRRDRHPWGSHSTALAVRQPAILCRVAHRRRGRASALRPLGILASQPFSLLQPRNGALSMNDINQSILTLILLVPIAGAVLIAVLPDRG